MTMSLLYNVRTMYGVTGPRLERERALLYSVHYLSRAIQDTT